MIILRIASLHSGFGERGGAERSILEQARYLAKNNEITIFGTYVNPSKCYPDLMMGLDMRQLVGVPVTKFDLLINTALGLFLARRFHQDLEGYEILLSHQEPAHWIAFCAKRPYVVQVRSLLPILYPEFGDTFAWDSDLDRVGINLAVNSGGRRYLRFIDQNAVRGANKVVVHSKMAGKAVQDIYSVRPVQLPYGVDFSSYPYADPNPIFTRYSVSRPLILMVTRPIPSKRPDLMIRIMPRILRDHPTATLVIACGTGSYTFLWRRLAQRIGVAASTRIISVSPREINALYCGATVAAFPTQAPETLGRVVLEAMHFGVPPVVWDNGWGPSEVVVDGVGFRARAYDIDDFTDKILTLLGEDDLRLSMGRKAKQYAESNFSWEKAGPALEEILKNAC